ncbi:MAG: insulinase family protein [Hyphomicrobiales bacterium]|nr:insulinase family protein [Hyphomicrobiales bacterium]MDE2114700.1 insulinase family protein [Hyphomicrobiales bacterium]
MNALIPSVGLTLSPNGAQNAAMPANISHFTLANGMEVVLIEDHRAPVVTHMVWYKNGSAEDLPLKSGIAHFLEHLMFKGTKNHAKGKFSEMVAELGGQENAFTSNDYTAYFQRVARDHLRVVMDYEADRMINLVLDDATVDPEREVVMEERRMRTDNDPAAQLQEAVQAALFTQHPYGRPVIGWGHEIETLNRHDAIAYYERFYTPENAILVVAGDIGHEELTRLANETYGKIPARGAKPERLRPQEPPARAHRLVSLSDEKVEQPSLQALYLVPSVSTAKPGEAEALEVLSHMLGGGPTSILYKGLVLDQKIAVAAGAYYMGTAVDDTRFYVFAIPNDGVTLEALDAAVEKILEAVRTTPVDAGDLVRAKTRLVADTIYAQDSQASLARWFGAALATGMSVGDIASWPQRVQGVQAEDVQKAAEYLQKQRAVTGYLMPKEP